MAAAASSPRVLAIMGSGETSPGMVPVHRELLSRAEPGRTPVLLDSPYGFQENADELSARIADYFDKRLEVSFEVASLRATAAAGAADIELFRSRVRAAGLVFAGPGSPSYALDQWRRPDLGALLRDKLRGGGVVVFASAAAISLGRWALPVYEVYKVGAPPAWLSGLDVLAELGIEAAVIPHWDNAEGGTHDTRFCYMGARRLAVLEAMLPPGAAMLGIDEHTAVIFDLGAGEVSVRGRGALTVRRHGSDVVHLAAGELLPLAALSTGGGGGDDAPPAARPLLNVVAAGAAAPMVALRVRCAQALSRRDVTGALTAALDAERGVAAAMVSTAGGRAERAELRGILSDLADTACAVRDPKALVGPLVEAVLTLRSLARSEGRYADADRLRDALVAAGVSITDLPEGTTWDLVGLG